MTTHPSSLRISVVQDGKEHRAPAFISVGHVTSTATEGGGYRPISAVVSQPNLRSEAVTTALRALVSIRNRYDSIRELDPVWEAIEQAVEQAEVKPAATPKQLAAVIN